MLGHLCKVTKATDSPQEEDLCAATIQAVIKIYLSQSNLSAYVRTNVRESLVCRKRLEGPCLVIEVLGRVACR